MRVQQVSPWEQWPSGDSRPIAVLPFSLADLSARYGLEYEEGVDDLDRYYLAAVELGNGEQAWIYKHESDPNPGTVVHVDAKSDVEKAQAMLADVFGLKREDFSWAAPAPVLAR
jgi:hypothetical protein